MEITAKNRTFSVPGYKYPARLHNIGSTGVWARLSMTACKQEDFDAAPKQLEILGHTLDKRSFVYDGILYCSREEDLVARETLQSAVSEWTRSVFTTATPQSIAERAVIESLELLHAVHHNTDESDDSDALEASLHRIGMAITGYFSDVDNKGLQHKEPQFRRRVAMECADITQVIIDMAAVVGFDLDSATREKLEINKARKWSEPDESNQRRHLAENEVVSSVDNT